MGANNSKKATFYHDYGNGGWVYTMGTYEERKSFGPVNENSRSVASGLQPKYTTNQDLYNYAQINGGVYGGTDFCRPTITQYPRPGEVSQGSDNNISFNGGGWTYTMDMGPYVDVNNANRYNFKGIANAPGYGGIGVMWARAKDPDGFELKNANNYNIPFRVTKIGGDARDWPAWYLWVAQPLKPGTILKFNHYFWLTVTTPAWTWGNNDDWVRVTITEDRLGQTEGGVRFAPVTDAVGNTWGLNHP